MTITEAERHVLHQRLEEVLGTDEANTLMEHLPPVGWSDVATRRDLDHVEGALRSDLERVDTGLRAQMSDRFADMTRTIMFGMVASNATLVGLVVAVVKLA